MYCEIVLNFILPKSAIICCRIRQCCPFGQLARTADWTVRPDIVLNYVLHMVLARLVGYKLKKKKKLTRGWKLYQPAVLARLAGYFDKPNPI